MRSLKVEKDRIVGIDEWGTKREKVFYPEFNEFPSCGQLSPFTIDFEKILELDPDIVTLYATGIIDACERAQNELEDLNPNIVVLRFDCWEPETYTEEVQKLGYIFDKREEADEFLELYSGVMNTINERVEGIPEDERPRVYYEHTNPYQVSWGGGGGYNRRLEMAGAKLIFGDISPLGPAYVDPEEVVARDPEIIVKLGRGGYDTDDLTLLSSKRDEIMNRPELASVTAIKNKRVYVCSSKIVATTFFVGIAYTAKWFYPELFEDLDPKAIHQQYLTEFQELDYDVYEHGVFVYPEQS
jgi:iron complex transport system substrate-binding protein